LGHYLQFDSLTEQYWANAKFSDQVRLSPLKEVFQLWVRLHSPFLSEHFGMSDSPEQLFCNKQVQELFKSMISQRIKNLRDASYRDNKKKRPVCDHDNIDDYEDDSDNPLFEEVERSSEFY
jgi:hypothetical protein